MKNITDFINEAKLENVNETFKFTVSEFLESYPTKPVGGSDRISFDIDYKSMSKTEKSEIDKFYKENK